MSRTKESQLQSSERYALVTGAASGIGKGVAKMLATQGYRLWLLDINQAGLEAMLADCPDARLSILDLSDFDRLASFCNELEQFDARLDIAFINAGVVTPGQVTELDRTRLTRDVDVNLKSAMWLNQACAKKMKRQGSGQIINTVSTAGLVSLKGAAGYSASKFGLRGFLIALQSEIQPYGVDVSMLLPSAVDTPMLQYEAEHGGSALNFLSKPSTVELVVATFEKARKTKKLEYSMPKFDGFLGRVCCVFPNLLILLHPLLEHVGERGRARYLARKR